MKRRQPITPLLSTPPSTPPPSPCHAVFTSKKPRNVLKNPKSLCIIPTTKWEPLHIGKSELYLPLTFPTGQTFRWKQTGPVQYTGVIGSHLVSLKQLDDGDVGYHFHSTKCSANARTALFDFLNLEISLCEVWEEFKTSDPRFAELSTYLKGARVLRQDPLECLIQFICSSNNNIQRITKMVDFVSSLGNILGNVGGFDFHEFPKLEQLAMVSETELREAGFGYRFFFLLLLLISLNPISLVS